ncbi:uncharacterized protein LOC117573098 isoform X8 [Drosophila albomicans]|uniref:Uncharacterized protein LOC117573098 isoform X8 n=1 Tax=Drosophila albomicans TaxID=7291 RepID=A0A6P8XKK7_DROAB|nr:uncharacterized protein LOC117573098 isoform X8 [Drosophila albomicans]
MDSVTMTEIHETEISNSNENENVPSTADITSKDEEGAEIKKDIQDTATATATDQSSISKDNFADDKENENPEKINIISTDKKNEEKTETDAISAVIVDDIKNVESSEEKEIGTVLSIEVTESRDVSDENEQKQNTESLVKADIVDSPVTSNNEQIEPKYDTTETSTQDIEEDVEEEEDSEDSETSSEDEMPVADTNKKTEKVEDSNISKPSDSGNVVQNEEVKEEVKNVNTNDISNQIENIISDIDINIKAQEKIAHLKEQELELIEKQKQLTNQIHQQQLLAQKLIAQNQIKENELKRSQEIQQQQQVQNENLNQYRQDSVLETYANNYNQIQDDIYKTKESSNLSRTVDLRKIFTPATDAPQILPKNRKLYASSAFYSPTLHPTVEDQVELARRISHSLSDISNQKSKGQSMFVNRKKRSVKWVHEGSFQDFQQYPAKPPLSPSILPAYSDAGKHRVQLNLHQDHLIEKYSKPGVTVVKSPWEAALQTGSASTAFLQDPTYSNKQTATSSFGSPVHFKQDVNDFSELTHSYSRPPTFSNSILSNTIAEESNKKINDTRLLNQRNLPCNPQRELAYKPSVAQGWGGRNVELPKGLYVPKEISLTSYAPPPVQQGSSIANYAKGCSTGIGETLKGFPISNTGLYSSQPPKQQLYGQQSYVKGPTSFSPSPIPYEKLSKFEETSNQRSLNQSFINVDKTNGYNNLRNVTPAPFGTELENRNYPPQSSVYNNKRVHNAPVTSFPSQSFNNCARGWSVGSGNQQNLVFSPKGQVSANRLPYSDF